MEATKQEPKYGNLKERWDWIIAFMVLEDIFVHEILLMMDKRPTKAVPTMGVTIKDARITMYYNEDFVMSLSDPELRYIITHEVYHLILHHCTKRASEDIEQARLFNIAADLAVNSLIPISADRKPPVDEEGKKIGCFPSDCQFGFEEKLSMEQYLQLLRDKNGEGKGQGKEGQNPNRFDDHSEWDESEVADQMVKDKVEQLSRSERAWGKMSSDVQAIIMAAQKSQVPWTKILRHYFGHLISSERIGTFKKPNRRYPYPYHGSVPKNIDKKLVAIDTSGSVRDQELSQFLAEVNKLSEVQPVDVMLFDWDITQEPAPFDRKKRSYDFKGRGGTNFHPVMELAEKRRYSSLIILTDGEALAPPRPKYVKDIIWVLCGTSNPPVEWGKRVRVENKIGY